MPNYKISGSVAENAKINVFAQGNYIGYALVNAGAYEVVFSYESLVPVSIEAENTNGSAVAYGQVIPEVTSDSVNIITDYTKINSLYGRLTDGRATLLDNLSRVDTNISDAVLSGGRQASIDKIDEVESRLSAVRAGYLDEIPTTNSGTSVLLDRLTDGRATNLDNISMIVGAHAPIGSAVALIDNKTYMATIDSKKYLKTGVLASYSSEENSNLLPDYMHLTYKQMTGNTSNMAVPIDFMEYYSGNGYYYIIYNGSTYYIPSWTGTLTACTSASYALWDWCFWNGYITNLGVNSTYGLNSNAAGGPTVVQTFNNTASEKYYCLDVNAAKTLVVVCRSTGAVSGNILTMTSYGAATNRTPSGAATTSYISYAFWSPLANAFTYITEDGHIYTTTDGYTLTERHNIGTTAAAGSYPKTQIATSPTSTIIIRGGSLIRTTNGTTFTVTTIDKNLLGYDNFSAPNRIGYVNGVYYLFNTAFYSLDDGLTWTKTPKFFISTSEVSLYSLIQTNGKNIATCNMTPYFFEFTNLYQPSHVGDITARTLSGYPGYIRLK